MNRRQFVQAAAVAGLGRSAVARDGQPVPSRARLIVDGLDASVMNEGFLKLLRTGGAHCVHQSFPNVIAGLEKRGWPKPDLDKFLGGNWLRVYERVWGA